MRLPEPTSLIDALLAFQPDPVRPRVIVVRAPQAAALTPPAPAAPRSGAWMRPIGAMARLLLRSARAKRLVLGLLARVPSLHARALAVMFPATSVITLDDVPPPARMGTPPEVRGRPCLAFVSPLPPERTGIADYAAQLLPALMAHFDIVLVVQQDMVTLPPALATLPVEDPAWLRANAHAVDHILYQIGNSEFHSHMFALLRDHPGAVVLHDFFLGNVMAYRQMRRAPAGAWTGALFHSHGYPALRAYLAAPDRTALFKTYPCNLAVLEQASAVIVHSGHAAALAQQWYGEHATRNWHSVPLPRAAPPVMDRTSSRAALGIADDVFLVCSFGYIVPNKLGDRLLAAWLASSLQADPRCLLVLVGANQDSPFGAQVARLVASAQGRVRIAGWSDDTVYRQYLQAADMGVQLRTRAQGETSAAVLDCMNYGLATIVNANGSMAGLPDDTVLRLPDEFGNAELTTALESLYRDHTGRMALGSRAARLLAGSYRPDHAASLYAAALRHAQPGSLHVRRLLVDIHIDNAELIALLAETAIRVEPVRLVLDDGQWRWRHARLHAARLLGFTWDAPDDPLIEMVAGDIVYCAQPAAATAAAGQAGLWDDLRQRGVLLAFGWEDVAADVVLCRDDAPAAAYNSGC
jgi:hypothetical protein